MTREEAIAFLEKRGYTIVEQPDKLYTMVVQGLKMQNRTERFVITHALLLEEAEGGNTRKMKELKLLPDGIGFYLDPESCSYVIRYALKESNGGTYEEEKEYVFAKLGRCVSETLTPEELAYATGSDQFQQAIQGLKSPVAWRYILTDGQRLIHVLDNDRGDIALLLQDSHLDFDRNNKEVIQALLQEEEEE